MTKDLDGPPELDPEPELTDEGYRDVKGDTTSGYDHGWVDPYRELGGLARPDAYYGAKEFDCPNCHAIKGERCVNWVERLGRNVVRKMPCLIRISLARKAGML